jgi:methyl-accepting chemotaxis protein
MLRRLTIRTRLFAAFALLSLLVAALGAVAYRSARQQHDAMQHFNREVRPQLAAIDELVIAELNSRRYEKDLLVNHGNADKQREYREKWEAEQQTLTRLLGTLPAASAQAVRPSLEAYAASSRPVFDQLGAGSLASVAEANAALKAAKASVYQAEAALAVLRREGQQAADASFGQLDALYRQVVAAIAGAVLAAALLVVALGWRISRSIVRPLDEAAAFARRVAAGDLVATLQPQGRDEASALQHGLAEMRDSLRAMVWQLHQATEHIATASGEIACGNQDLSSRTEQAAASLQQTAASVEQLNGNLRLSAEAAGQAHRLAGSACSVASEGGAVVEQVVTTMAQINHSSRQISDIIGVIDGIAFQTNILALNAAVEAARAGEQGRGFAVVASEVRSLAQRSASAAREIKVLIGTSVDRVESGSALVGQAGATMQQIVASVRRVSDIISEMSQASHEQAGGIGQVHGAVSKLDQMTQQNAALVEQSAAAAESLRSQAGELAGMVSRFRLT